MSWNVILLARGRRYSTAATCGSVYQDAMSPSTFLVAYLTLLSLSVVPAIAFIFATVVPFGPIRVGELPAHCIATSKFTRMRHPRPGMSRR